MSENYDVSALLKKKQTFKVRYAFLSLTLKLLTPEDNTAARLAATEPGEDPKNPKINDRIYVNELFRRCVLKWSHHDGGKIINDGKNFKCTPENIVYLAENGLPGLIMFITQNCSNADRMYRTLDENEIKN